MSANDVMLEYQNSIAQTGGFFKKLGTLGKTALSTIGNMIISTLSIMAI